MAEVKVEVPETNPVDRDNDDLDKASGGLDKVSGGLADDDVSDVAGGALTGNHNETFLAAP